MDSRAVTPSPEELLAHADFVGRVALALVKDEHDAEDVAQETMARALARPPRLRGSLRSWLAGVTRNVARMRWRSRERRARREIAAARPEGLPSAADSAATVEILRRVTEAVGELAEPYRTTILDRYYRGLPPSEIARRTGVPVKTVKTRLSRGLERLRERLDEGDGGRRRWLAVLLPFARGVPGGITPVVSGAVIMSSSAKVLLAVVGAVVLLGVGYVALAPDGPGEPGPRIANAPPPATPPDPAPGRAYEVPKDAGGIPAPRAGAAVRVRVVDDATGLPVPGVAVHLGDLSDGDRLFESKGEPASLWISDALEDGSRTATVFADGEGRVTHRPSPGPRVAFVRHPGYRDWIGEPFPIRAGEDRDVTIRLVPYPENERGIEISGTVSDGSTTWPLAGAKVTGRYRVGKEIRSFETTTGDDGRYSCRAPANAMVTLGFVAAGYENGALTFNPIQQPWITGDVALIPVGGGPPRGQGRITGRITDAATYEPVPGAEVSLERGYDENGGGGIGGWSGWKTDERGVYRIDLGTVDSAEEWVRIVVVADGYRRHVSELVSFSPDRTTVHAIPLVRETGETGFAGRVVDARTGKPVPAARVLIRDVFGDVVSSAAAGESGRFRFPARGTERELVVRAEGYAERVRELGEAAGSDSRGHRDLEIRIEPADARIAGTIRGAATGEALAGATVLLYLAPEWTGPGPRTVTNGAGEYAFEVAPGRYLLQVSADGHGTDYLGPVEVAAGGTAKGDLALHATDAVLTGTVRNAAIGEELPEGAAEVFVLRLPTGPADELVCEMAGYHPPIEVETDGARYLARLVPGRYEVSVGLRGFGRLEREIVIRAGEELDLDLEVTPLPALDARIRGVVVRAGTDEPVPGCRVFLYLGETCLGGTAAGPNGTFELEAPAGEVRIVVPDPGGDAEPAEATVVTRSGKTTAAELRLGN